MQERKNRNQLRDAPVTYGKKIRELKIGKCKSQSDGREHQKEQRINIVHISNITWQHLPSTNHFSPSGSQIYIQRNLNDSQPSYHPVR